MIDDTLDLCGTVVAEKYEVEAVVGKGGFSLVYRARHLLWKRPVALKVFRVLEAAAEVDLQPMTDELVKEASVLAELSEKTASICQARDLGVLTTPSGQTLPYMVLEWLEGKTLGETLTAEQAGHLPPRSLQATVTLLDPVAEALAVAHSHGIAHRDVKPTNVFLTTDAEGRPEAVKLLDFGIAKVVQDAQNTGAAFQKTEGVVTAFTPTYGAPEQFSRKFGATGPWTDVFSLALVLVECCTGRRVTATRDFMQLAAVATDTTRRPTPRALGIATSDATEAVFARALAVQPTERYPTAGAFWVALLGSLGIAPSRTILAVAEAIHEAARSLPGAAVAPPSRRTSGRRILAIGAALGVAFCAALYAGLRYDRATSGPGPDDPPPVASTSSASVASAPHARGAATSASPTPVAKAAECPGGMTLVPGGEFFMGSDDGLESERPAHHVELSPYCIDLYEVTSARYSACSDTGKCKRAGRANDWPGITTREHETFDPLCSAHDPLGQAEHPVVCIDWSMADTFCRTVPGGRLPTEAEWEFAARGPDGWPTTTAVGSFPRGKSRFGLFDVSGNVCEWVADWQAPYAKASTKNPSGPPEGKAKVIRGGAWNSSVDAWVTPTFRFMNHPEARSYGVGFRCAATPR